jgi:hypothetical protein
MRPRRRALVALLGIALPTACTIVNGLHVPPPKPPAEEAGDTCNHAGLPPPKQDAGDRTGPSDIVVAVNRFDLGLDAGAPVIGFDLDGVCTICNGDGGGGRESCATTTAHCDDSQGRDNATQALFRGLQAFGVDIGSSLNANIQSGISTVLIRVKNYNGLPDDPEVFVSIFGSPGLRQKLDDGGVSFTPPAFDGSDRWSLNQQELAPDVDDKYVSVNAVEGYVVDRQLVASLKTASLPLRAGVAVDLQQLVLVATIDPSVPTITGGTFAARWLAVDALKAAGESSVPNDLETPLCNSTLFEQIIRPAICPAADLAIGGGPSAPCDALSVAFAFGSGPALLGEILQLPLIPSRCTDAGVFHCP